MNAKPYGIKPYNTESDMDAVFIIERTAALVAAYVSRNALPREDLPQAIRCIHAALSDLQRGSAQVAAVARPTGSAISASIRHDRLISFIDGKAYKTLKRHLTAHGMTPSQYRSRYALPSDYPMVSADYANLRSRIARQAFDGPEAA